MTRIEAIPTIYKGTRFRSRLEAKWAAFFDLRGWAWEYEPIDLAGYIPDFILPDFKRPTLIEVKPAMHFDEMVDPIVKMFLSGWADPFVCVGARLIFTAWGTCVGVTNSGSYGDLEPPVVNREVVPLAPVALGCLHCPAGLLVGDGVDVLCLRCRTMRDDGSFPHGGYELHDEMCALWGEASARVQWKGRDG